MAQHKSKLYSSIKKHGFDNHSIEVAYSLPSDVTKDILTNYEQFYVDQLREAWVSVLNMGQMVNSSKGVKHSEETRRKVSMALKGNVCSPETRRKISEAQIGKIISRDQVERANEKKRGRKQGPEIVRKRALAMIGMKKSPEACKNISNSLMGKIRSEESKKRQSESLKKNPVRYWLGKKLPQEVIDRRQATRRLNDAKRQGGSHAV